MRFPHVCVVFLKDTNMEILESVTPHMLCVCACMCACMHACVCMCVCVCACMHACVCVHACVCMHVRACMCVCVYLIKNFNFQATSPNASSCSRSPISYYRLLAGTVLVYNVGSTIFNTARL